MGSVKYVHEMQIGSLAMSCRLGFALQRPWHHQFIETPIHLKMVTDKFDVPSKIEFSKV